MTKDLQIDDPIKNVSEDRLGRSTLAMQLAKTLSKSDLADGFAIGLYGEWGTGKTSLFNMMEEALRKMREPKRKGLKAKSTYSER
jgi:predicted KAP-like P-loop ATPase